MWHSFDAKAAEVEPLDCGRPERGWWRGGRVETARTSWTSSHGPFRDGLHPLAMRRGHRPEAPNIRTPLGTTHPPYTSLHPAGWRVASERID